MSVDLPRRLAAEAVGTCLLVAAVVGSGVTADALSSDGGVALLGNTLPTAAILVVLIATLGPVSGAHFNPAVTLVFAMRRELGPGAAVGYGAAQVAGGVAGCLLAHAMFGLDLVSAGTAARTGPGQWLAEVVATFGLVATIIAGARRGGLAVAWLVGLYIAAAYWFTASTSFANPAVTIARSLSDTFSGIRPQDAPAFVLAQILGALLALGATGWLFGPAPAAEPAAAGTRAGP
jgi:glycerol uptake facilitator-like aquaporin